MIYLAASEYDKAEAVIRRDEPTGKTLYLLFVALVKKRDFTQGQLIAPSERFTPPSWVAGSEQGVQHCGSRSRHT